MFRTMMMLAVCCVSGKACTDVSCVYKRQNREEYAGLGKQDMSRSSTWWILCQRNTRGPVGVVFNALQGALSITDAALEVNYSVQSFMCPSSVVGCDPALSITPSCVPDALCEGLERPTFPQARPVSGNTTTHSCRPR